MVENDITEHSREWNERVVAAADRDRLETLALSLLALAEHADCPRWVRQGARLLMEATAEKE
jgi:hypothetical protein